MPEMPSAEKCDKKASLVWLTLESVETAEYYFSSTNFSPPGKSPAVSLHM